MFKKILVPLDGSKLAEEALPNAQYLATTLRADLTLIRVALAHTFPGADPAEHQVKVVHEAEQYLANVENRLKGLGLNVHSVVRYGHEANEIVDHAKVHGFDLIVMSTHGRTALGQFVLGSVAIKVVHISPVPVLLHRVC